jgi:hypothetical protein
MFADAVEQILAGKVSTSEIELTAPTLFAVNDPVRARQKLQQPKNRRQTA